MSIQGYPLLGLLLFAACLPRDDLSSYSDSPLGEGGTGESGPTDASSGGSGGLLGGGGSVDENPDQNLPIDGSLSDASAAGEDAGVANLLDASTASDSGALDAGPLVNTCTANQGTLEPGTNVCLIFVSAARVTWQAAVLGCQTRNAVLVSIEDVARNDFLTSLIGSTDIWTGGNDPGTNPAANAFVWRDNTPVSSTLGTWAAGEPDAVADQFCVAKTGEPAAPPGPASPWRDRPCSELKAYVCEQSL